MHGDLQSIDHIRAYSGDQDAVFVAALGLKAYYMDKPLTVRRALCVRRFWLIETDNEPDNWWMGQRDDDGVVRVWGQYGKLQDAIDGL